APFGRSRPFALLSNAFGVKKSAEHLASSGPFSSARNKEPVSLAQVSQFAATRTLKEQNVRMKRTVRKASFEHVRHSLTYEEPPHPTSPPKTGERGKKKASPLRELRERGVFVPS